MLLEVTTCGCDFTKPLKGLTATKTKFDFSKFNLKLLFSVQFQANFKFVAS